VAAFRSAAEQAGIPEIRASKSLRDILDWTLNALARLKPKIAYVPPEGGRIEVGLFGSDAPPSQDRNDADAALPQYVSRIKDALEAVLVKTDLAVWLMVDRLDEIFPRRSDVETNALRGLLRTLRIFESPRIRVKVFLRDDILEAVTATSEGFTALSHVTARRADTLRWSPEGIVTLITKRLFAAPEVADALDVDIDQIAASQEYRERAFYSVFPSHVYSPRNQSPTIRWIYARSRDGRGVVTPRDVIDLLTKARQHQLDEYHLNQIGTTDSIIGKEAIRYGWWEMSKQKRDTLLKAEFPHLWPHIEKFAGGKAEYSDAAIRALLGRRSDGAISDLVKVGVLEKIRAGNGRISYKIPFLYRGALGLTQGRQE
jgi:hypothetical protein